MRNKNSRGFVYVIPVIVLGVLVVTGFWLTYNKSADKDGDYRNRSIDSLNDLSNQPEGEVDVNSTSTVTETAQNTQSTQSKPSSSQTSADNEIAFNGSEPSAAEKHWQRVFKKAFEPVSCPKSRDPQTLPDGYYKGPMIDTHIHLHSLPDGEPGHPEEYYTGNNLGIERSMDEWICVMNLEGTIKAFGFFPVWEPIIPESIEAVKRTMEMYPGKFAPFIMPPDDDGAKDGSPTVDAKKLDEMLAIEPQLFKGYGEIGLYERGGGAGALPPDSKRLTEIYPVIRKNKLVVYFHLGERQGNALEKVAKANPDITFIFHGDQLIDCGQCDKTPDAVAEILENNPNVYYGVDELYGNVFLLNDRYTKEEFIAHFDDYEPLFKKDMENWKEFIEKHPDQVLWGTDRGVSARWDLDPKVAITLNDYTRAFIGKLDPAVQEKWAYKNALRILGE